MALDQVTFDIVEQTAELTQLGSLFYLERLHLEVNTRGQTLTPTLTLETTAITLPTVSTTARDLVDVTIDRLGPMSTLTLSPVSGMQWYLAELVIRPLVLGLRLVARGVRTAYPGRSSSISTTVRWDINPFSLPADARNQQLIVKRIYVEIVTGAETVTPVIEYADGTTETLASITQATRGVVERAVLTAKRLRAFRLDGDFTNSSIVIYDVEMDCYSPSARALAVG